MFMDNNVPALAALIGSVSAGEPEAQAVRLAFCGMNAVDIAEALEKAGRAERIAAFRLLDEKTSADVFSYLLPETQESVVDGLTDTEVTEVMEVMSIDDMVDFIEDAPDEMAKRVLDSVSTERSQVADRLLDYPDDSAGSIMTTEVVELSKEMSVRDALGTIRSSGVDKETIYTCYVVEADKSLVGVVTADTLLYSEPGERIGNVMKTNFIYAEAGDDQEELAAKFSKYDLLAMPVVSRAGGLVGIVTVDDILRVMKEEDTEDFSKIAGVKPSEETYLKTGVFAHFKNRILWLLVLMLAATIAGIIIDAFEEPLQAVPILIAFVPMLMGAGGNAGAQASTIVIRGISLGDIGIGDLPKIVWKEARIAVVCSLILGAANFARIYWMHGGREDAFTLSWVVSLSLCITFVISKTIGCALPLVAKKLKMDPAVMAAPLITTIVDCSALVVFFMIASNSRLT